MTIQDIINAFELEIESLKSQAEELIQELDNADGCQEKLNQAEGVQWCIDKIKEMTSGLISSVFYNTNAKPKTML